MQLRKELRKKIKERLLGKNQAFEKINVNQRAYDKQSPFIEITTPEDESELISNSIRATGHNPLVLIDVVAEEKIDIYDELDDLAEDIETQIEKDETFGGITSSLILTKTEADAVFEAERTIGFIRLYYKVSYVKQKTPRSDPKIPKLKDIVVGGMDA